MHIDVNIRFHPEKIRELRDLYGIGAEADVYKDFFDVSISKVVEALLREGFDPIAVKRAVETYKPDLKKAFDPVRADNRG